jgi:hypothetical protein
MMGGGPDMGMMMEPSQGMMMNRGMMMDHGMGMGMMRPQDGAWL